MARLEPEPIALRDRRQDQNRLGHCKSRPNANPLTRSERDIAEPRRFGRKSVWIETMRLVPERRLAVQEPRSDQNDGARWNTPPQHVIGGNLLARYPMRRREKGQSFPPPPTRVAPPGPVLLFAPPARKD